MGEWERVQFGREERCLENWPRKQTRVPNRFHLRFSPKGYNSKSLHHSPFWTSMTPSVLPTLVGAGVEVCFWWQIWHILLPSQSVLTCITGFLGALLWRKFGRELCEGLWSAHLKPGCHELAYQARPSLTTWVMSRNSQWLVEARGIMLVPHLSFLSRFLPPHLTGFSASHVCLARSSCGGHWWGKWTYLVPLPTLSANLTWPPLILQGPLKPLAHPFQEVSPVS